MAQAYVSGRPSVPTGAPDKLLYRGILKEHRLQKNIRNRVWKRFPFEATTVVVAQKIGNLTLRRQRENKRMMGPQTNQQSDVLGITKAKI